MFRPSWFASLKVGDAIRLYMGMGTWVDSKVVHVPGPGHDPHGWVMAGDGYYVTSPSVEVTPNGLVVLDRGPACVVFVPHAAYGTMWCVALSDNEAPRVTARGDR